MTRQISLSIFFPAFNEEENIEKTVLRTIQVVEGSPYIDDYEIIVVNDGSSDATLSISSELSQRFPAVRVISHEKNRGYGAALKTGISAARMNYVFFTDADLQFDIVELQNLLVHLAEYPVVIGYRAPRRDPFMRLVNAWGWNLLNRALFGLRVRDIDCGFKIFRRETIQGLGLQSKGMMIGAETLIRLCRKGVQFKEVPVTHWPRRAGSATGAKPSAIVRAFREMIRLYWGDLGPITHKQTLKFLTVGLINTSFDISVYILLTRSMPFFLEYSALSKLIAFLVGTVSSFLVNRSWTFDLQHRPTIGEVIRFYSVMPVSLVLNVATMSLLVAGGVYKMTALILSAIVTFTFNIALSRFWVYSKRSKPVNMADTETKPI